MAAAALLFLALATPASARPEIGPTSSASVSISISVAPKFRLRANGVPNQRLEKGTSNSSAFCLATNGEQLSLPMLLVRAKAGEEDLQATGEAELLPWCAPGGLPAAGHARSSGTADMLIVHPD